MKAYEAPALARVAVEVVNALLVSGGMTGGEVGCVDDSENPGGDVIFSVNDKLNIFR